MEVGIGFARTQPKFNFLTNLLVINIKDHDIAFTAPQETLNIYFWKS
jgi:hypothetical protein